MSNNENDTVAVHTTQQNEQEKIANVAVMRYPLTKTAPDGKKDVVFTTISPFDRVETFVKILQQNTDTVLEEMKNIDAEAAALLVKPKRFEVDLHLFTPEDEFSRDICVVLKSYAVDLTDDLFCFFMRSAIHNLMADLEACGLISESYFNNLESDSFNLSCQYKTPEDRALYYWVSNIQILVGLYDACRHFESLTSFFHVGLHNEKLLFLVCLYLRPLIIDLVNISTLSACLARYTEWMAKVKEADNAVIEGHCEAFNATLDSLAELYKVDVPGTTVASLRICVLTKLAWTIGTKPVAVENISRIMKLLESGILFGRLMPAARQAFRMVVSYIWLVLTGKSPQENLNSGKIYTRLLESLSKSFPELEDNMVIGSQRWFDALWTRENGHIYLCKLGVKSFDHIENALKIAEVMKDPEHEEEYVLLYMLYHFFADSKVNVLKAVLDFDFMNGGLVSVMLDSDVIPARYKLGGSIKLSSILNLFVDTHFRDTALDMMFMDCPHRDLIKLRRAVYTETREIETYILNCLIYYLTNVFTTDCPVREQCIALLRYIAVGGEILPQNFFKLVSQAVTDKHLESYLGNRGEDMLNFKPFVLYFEAGMISRLNPHWVKGLFPKTVDYTKVCYDRAQQCLFEQGSERSKALAVKKLLKVSMHASQNFIPDLKTVENVEKLQDSHHKFVSAYYRAENDTTPRPSFYDTAYWGNPEDTTCSDDVDDDCGADDSQLPSLVNADSL